ncbi:hypothetical protein KC19_7G117500 [Ceratodon purpureus]|uniref:Uncharacterized protein n=1 Tax=Ceratodon purpureus TaxID=3225 RepID=A0A8T0H5B4_CERPU|nr:hypothetical protein KC19_7G117500 [Ceratodon purpureus]
MAQSWVRAGMQAVECGARVGWMQSVAKTSPKGQQLLVVRCSGQDGKKKGGLRLPGGPQMPAYGSSGGYSKSAPGLGQFKPPSMFGRPAPNETTQEEKARVEAILEQIRGGIGTWQERAAGVSELQRLGFGLEEIYTQAYVPAPTQTSMVVAAQVYQSMVEAGCPPDLLSWFDESKVEILYSLRTLSAKQRRSAAEYVRDNDLDVVGALELAKAIKDHERRPEGRQVYPLFHRAFHLYPEIVSRSACTERLERP